ncbi:hypothetical protein NVS89_04485 [Ancylobacter sp. MQZ15Z-1]|uniref:Uncharacterized protein n=1 Tax=Ancylobacter mangrovi TaxID=2972472 RepID=A0A9X2PBH2_9HYPH|nr:hypothetical protein [Ancylobacter mangrovi]MCS0494344.1 hypothetical protein [Ancylobacter mangrovi]
MAAGEPNSLPRLGKKQKYVFVAYPYRIYNKNDYRKPYHEIAKAFSVTFVFADERISTLHILDKIRGHIRECEFGIYDITGWNPNVTLELGLALGLGEKAFIAFDPKKTELKEVPSDVQGIDRIQYDSFYSLGEQLTRLIGQEFPIQRRHEAQGQMEKLRQETLDLIAKAGLEGIGVSTIAEALGANVELIKVVVRPMVGKELFAKGKKRGTKYLLRENGIDFFPKKDQIIT